MCPTVELVVPASKQSLETDACCAVPVDAVVVFAHSIVRDARELLVYHLCSHLFCPLDSPNIHAFTCCSVKPYNSHHWRPEGLRHASTLYMSDYQGHHTVCVIKQNIS